MENPFPDNEYKILCKYFGVGLCRNANSIVNIIDRLSGFERNDNGIPILGVTVEIPKSRLNGCSPYRLFIFMV